MDALPVKELHEVMLKNTQHDTQPNDAFERGYRKAEERLLPEIEKRGTNTQTVVSEYNALGKKVALMDPLLKKLIGIVAAPLLEELESPDNDDGVICIGEDQHSYHSMGRLIRDLDPRGLKYVREWILANEYLKRRTG